MSSDLYTYIHLYTSLWLDQQWQYSLTSLCGKWHWIFNRVAIQGQHCFHPSKLMTDQNHYILVTNTNLYELNIQPTQHVYFPMLTKYSTNATCALTYMYQQIKCQGKSIFFCMPIRCRVTITGEGLQNLG